MTTTGMMKLDNKDGTTCYSLGPVSVGLRGFREIALALVVVKIHVLSAVSTARGLIGMRSVTAGATGSVGWVRPNVMFLDART